MHFSDEKLQRTAFHESGHAWMMVRENLGVRSASIRRTPGVRGDNRGLTVPRAVPEEGQQALSVKFARAALAGSAAENYLLGRWDEEGLQARSFDVGRAKGFMTASGNDWSPEALDHYVQSLSNTVLEEISRPRTWHLITMLACELLTMETLDGEQVTGILLEE